MIEAGGRVAVVTGAARGIGQAIALRLAQAGHTLALGDLHPADETVAAIKAVKGQGRWVGRRSRWSATSALPAVAFLASDEAAMISGQTLRIDGGLVTL